MSAQQSPDASETGPSLASDIVAGLTASAVVLPKAMAFATVAGLPVSVGLYTSCFAMLVYAFLGSSRVLSVSSTTTIAILAGAELSALVPDADPQKLASACAALAALVGLALLLASVLRLGFVANFISSPVLTGFKAGIGVVIVCDQLPKMLGLHVEKEGFFRDLASLVAQLSHTSLPTLTVAASTMLALFALNRLLPKAPNPLLAVALSILASWHFQLERNGVSIVGAVPQGLPSITWPGLGFLEVMVPGALGIALMSFTESIAAARAFADPDDGPVNPDRELAALGAANLCGAFLGAMPAGGGTSQTAVVRGAGGRSQVASMATAAAALATMLLLAPFLGMMPNATLAAVVVVYSVGLISLGEFASIRRVRRMELSWAVVAFLGVLFFGTLRGIVVAIVVSVIALASQASRPAVHILARKPGSNVIRALSPDHPGDETLEGLLMLRPEGRLFFMNSQYVGERIQGLVGEHNPAVLAIDMSRVIDLEYTSTTALQEWERRLTEQGVEVWLCGMNPAVLDVARRSGLADALGDRMVINIREVINRYESRSTASQTKERSDG
jgi:high affinity sulfate transporter 1